MSRGLARAREPGGTLLARPGAPGPGLLRVAGLLVTFLVLAPAQMPPDAAPPTPGWLGVHVETATAPAGTHPGVRVMQVVTASPAARAGLREGDLIVLIDGMPIPPDANGDLLAGFRERLRRHAPGDEVVLHLWREGEPEQLRLEVALGERPRPRALEDLRPDLEVRRPAWEPLLELPARERPAFWRQVERGLLEPLAQTEEAPDPLRLDDVALARRMPEAADPIARELGESLLRASAPEEGLDLHVQILAHHLGRYRAASFSLPPGPRWPAGGEPPVSVLQDLLSQLAAALERPVRRGGVRGAQEQRMAGARALLAKLAREPFLSTGATTVEFQGYLSTLRDSSQALDVQGYLQASLLALRVRDFVESVPPEAWEPGEHESSLGPIHIGTPADDDHATWAALRIDPGGSDRYRDEAAAVAMPGRPLAMIMDLGDGADHYEAGGAGGPVLAVPGIAVLVDAGGDDRYAGGRGACAATYGGVAILEDQAGNDHYEGRDLGLGAAWFGVGLLLDRSGDDRYAGDLFVQGVGLPGGAGVLLDLAGDDEYQAAGTAASVFGDPAGHRAMSLGCGLGLQDRVGGGLASGGLGVVVDAAGNDRYVGGEFSCGAGHFHGLGVLYDRSGDDGYSGAGCALGSGAHSGVGVLLDDAGDDVYADPGQCCLGAGYDLGIGTLVDAAGKDAYLGARWSLGAGAENGLGVFVDLDGADTYQWSPGLGLGRGLTNQARGGTSYGVWLDLGAELDRLEPLTGAPPPLVDGRLAGGAPAYREPAGDPREGGHGLAWDRKKPLAEPGADLERESTVDQDPDRPEERE